MQKGIHYTKIFHRPRIEAGLTCNQYVLASTIFHMQKTGKMDGWCFATKEWFAELLGVSKQSILNLIGGLVEKGFVEKNENGRFLRVTNKWENEIESFDFGKESLPKESKESLPKQKRQKVKKVYRNGKESLPSSVKKVYHDYIIDTNTDIDTDIDNTPNGVFSDENLEDFEKQISAKVEAELKAKQKPEKKKVAPKKKRESKWGDSFQTAKTFFDDYRKKWTKKRHGVDGEPIYWNPAECGQLSNLLTALKSKSKEAGHVYETDKDFIEAVFPVFLEYATRLEKYYMIEFTPTRFYSNFNTIYTDIKILFTNGTPSKVNGRNRISDEFKRKINDMLD